MATEVYNIPIKEVPESIFWVSEYEIILIHRMTTTYIAIYLIDLQHGTNEQIYITQSRKVFHVEKSGNNLLIVRNSAMVVSCDIKNKVAYERPQIRRFIAFGSGTHTILGDYLLEVSRTMCTLYKNQVEIHSMVMSNIKFQWSRANQGCIELFTDTQVYTLKIVDDKIECIVRWVGAYLGMSRDKRAFYMQDDTLVEFDDKIIEHPILKSGDRIVTPHITLQKGQLGPRLGIIDNRREINVNSKISYGNVSIKPAAFSYRNDALAYYENTLHIINWRRSIYGVYWKYVSKDVMHMRILLTVHLRRILPEPIVRIIIGLV